MKNLRKKLVVLVLVATLLAPGVALITRSIDGIVFEKNDASYEIAGGSRTW